MALTSAEAKAESMNAQQKKLGDIMKKTQDIIDQMLPKQVAAVRKRVFLMVRPLRERGIETISNKENYLEGFSSTLKKGSRGKKESSNHKERGG